MFPGAPKTTAGSSCRMRPKQQLLQAKRDRTHATTANDHEECDKQSSDNWDLADYRREATRIQNRRSTHREVMGVVSQILALLLHPLASQDADDAVPDEELCNKNLLRLHDFCASLQSGRRRKTAELVCAPTFQDVQSTCLCGQCALCCFHGVWQFARKKLVFDVPAGRLRPDVSTVWLTRIQWDRIKTGGDITVTCGYVDQLQRVTGRWFQAQGSAVCST
jgi:hypothetical protein